MYQSYHLHTTDPPRCQTWTETGSYFHPYESACQQRVRQRLPKTALTGPYHYAQQDAYREEGARHEAELALLAEQARAEGSAARRHIHVEGREVLTERDPSGLTVSRPGKILGALVTRHPEDASRARVRFAGRGLWVDVRECYDAECAPSE